MALQVPMTGRQQKHLYRKGKLPEFIVIIDIGLENSRRSIGTHRISRTIQ